jgi:hypothetical protein
VALCLLIKRSFAINLKLSTGNISSETWSPLFACMKVALNLYSFSMTATRGSLT